MVLQIIEQKEKAYSLYAACINMCRIGVDLYNNVAFQFAMYIQMMHANRP